MRIRQLSSSIVLIGLLSSTQVLAQETPAASPSPPEAAEPSAVTAEPGAHEPGPGAATTPPAAPPLGPSMGPATPKVVVVKIGDVGAGASTRGVGAAAGGMGSVGGPVTNKEEEWKFGFHGYFRAPMRIGIGERVKAKSDQAQSTLSIPQVPTDQYLDWQYTKSVQRSWAETYLSYGNKYAKGVIGLEAFQFTESSWSNPEAQFGIAQGWVELTPDLTSIDDSLKLNVKAGTFFSRYGGAGQYDAGAYDTFIGGRTHVMGETIRADYEVNDFVWYLEEGFGTNQPNPNVNHDTKYTLLAHGHVGVSYDQFITAELHYFHAWTQENDHACISREEEVAVQASASGKAKDDPAVTSLLAQYAEAPVGSCKWETQEYRDANGKLLQMRGDTPDGKLDIIAGDMVINGGLAGRFFVGGNVILAKNAFTVGPAVETTHADGGGFFKMGVTHQFLNPRTEWDNVGKNGRFGTGQILTLEGQWDLSISSLLEMGTPLDFQAFGMFTKVLESKDDSTMNGVTKLKFGGDVQWDPLSWFGIGIRGDRVSPRSDVPEESFTVLAPRMVFRSNFGTHEEIEIGYARYMYAQRECSSFNGIGILKCAQVPGAAVGPDGFGVYPGVNASKDQRGTTVDIASERGPYPDAGWDPPHENVLYISASMWW